MSNDGLSGPFQTDGRPMSFAFVDNAAGDIQNGSAINPFFSCQTAFTAGFGEMYLASPDPSSFNASGRGCLIRGFDSNITSQLDITCDQPLTVIDLLVNSIAGSGGASVVCDNCNIAE